MEDYNAIETQFHRFSKELSLTAAQNPQQKTKREGRQHGLVRTFHVLPAPLNPRPHTRIVNRVDSPPTAGIFTKVSRKPNNHSKFTGKCDRPNCTACHRHAGCKSKHKAKGTQKIRSSDAVLNYNHVTWQVMDHFSGPTRKLPVSGYSASRILDELANDYMGCRDDDDYYYNDDEELYENATTEDHDQDHENEEEQEQIQQDDIGIDDGEMDYYDVMVVWDPVDGDDGWSIVGGVM